MMKTSWAFGGCECTQLLDFRYYHQACLKVWKYGGASSKGRGQKSGGGAVRTGPKSRGRTRLSRPFWIFFSFFYRKNTTKTISILVKTNSFVRFFEEIDDPTNHFEINLPLMKKTLGFVWGIIFSKFWWSPWFHAKNHSPQTFQPAVYLRVF